MGEIMEEEKNIPGIRFKGFKGEWEERKLGEIMNVTSVKRIHQSDWTNTGIRFLRARDIVSIYKNENPSEYLYITKEKYFEYSLISGKVNTNDLLVTGVGTIGVPLLIKSDDPIYFKDGNIIWFKNENAINGNFLYYSFVGNRIQGYIKDSAGIGTVGTYTIESGKKTPLYFSTKQEQSQIGTFFQNLDKQIILEQQKHDKLISLKKAMLEKMFPKEGASVPEIRFKGFENPWIQKEINELFKITRGEVLAATETSQVKTGFMTYPVYSSQTKNNGLMGYYNDYLFENAITWTTDGANAGTVKYRKGKFYSTNVNGVLLSGEGYANQAIAESINRIAWKHVSYVGNPKLMNNVMSKINIYISDSLEEQQLISDYLNTFDTFISLQQQKIDKFKNIKKACLDKMFV